jgi:hypothetical protein
MSSSALGALLAAIEHRCQHFLQPLGIEQPRFEVFGNQIVEPFHRNRPAVAAGLALPGGCRAGVIAIATYEARYRGAFAMKAPQ